MSTRGQNARPRIRVNPRDWREREPRGGGCRALGVNIRKLGKPRGFRASLVAEAVSVPARQPITAALSRLSMRFERAMSDTEYHFTVRPLTEGVGYLVELHDLPGCMSDGGTIEKAIANGLKGGEPQHPRRHPARGRPRRTRGAR
jgi:hypothetical protein